MTARPTGWLALLCAAAIGCGDDAASIELPASSGGPVSGSGSRGDARVAECDGAPAGSECGEPGQGYHCIFDACVRNACGDRVLHTRDGEQCDDGNERDGDGCSATCKMEVEPGCGNGLIEPGEECDDENVSDDDICTAMCKRARCGDGTVSAGEECDDGNASDDDACTRACRDPKSFCGNRRLDLKEECDDGNAVMTDTCRNDCTLPPRCGDGSQDEGEECDDGNNVSGDGCQSDCKLPPSGGDAGSSGSSASGSGGTGGSSGTGGSGESGGSGDIAGSSGTGGNGGTGGTAGTSGTAGDDDQDAGTAGTGGTGGTGGDPDPNAQGIAQGRPGCGECREASCRDVDFSGLDAIGACFQAPLGTRSPLDAQLCIDVLDCAYTKDCAYGTKELSGCWCTGTTEACQRPAELDSARGPCFDTILAATKVLTDLASSTRAQQLDAAIVRFSQELYPSGAANWLLHCDQAQCADSCTPP